MIELEKTSTKMPCTCLTAGVASIRVNCQIYVTSVMINTFTVLRFCQNRVHYHLLFIFIVAFVYVGRQYTCILYSHVVVTDECDIFFNLSLPFRRGSRVEGN